MRAAAPTGILLVLALVGGAAAVTARPSSVDRVPDFSGTWVMQECDPTYARPYSRCELVLDQRGEAVDGFARYEDEYERWTCEVKGRVEEGALSFRWKGSKGWRGTARVAFEGAELRGTYVREDVEGTARQYCRGRRR
jgi:hypothetical protein